MGPLAGEYFTEKGVQRFFFGAELFVSAVVLFFEGSDEPLDDVDEALFGVILEGD